MKSIQDLLNLQNKSAIVTGGAKGIGLGISSRLAEAGANVLIADLNEASAQQAAETLSAKGYSVKAMKVDVSSEAEIRQMVNFCEQSFESLDILVNNAGIYPTNPLATMSVEDFDHVISVNLRSVFLTTKYGSEVMKSHGGGKIINISSIDSLHPSMVGLAHYDASKHGLLGFTKNSALELAEHKIWVNAIAPGGIATPGASGGGSSDIDQVVLEEISKQFLAKIPMHRMGDQDEIGTVALFLASDMSSYMTGSQIVVDGGVLLS
ncbi:MAG TPA: SDR family NAD(P)-dependent oxidoreductase [Candidatus Saccharimonadales bacterium]